MGFSKDFLNGLPRKIGPVNEWMTRLYENTAADGTLHLFAPYEYLTTGVLTCKMEWDSPVEQCAADFERLHAAAKAIAPHWDALQEEGADPAAILQDEWLLQVYRTYFLPLDEGEFDSEKVADISDRLDDLACAENAAVVTAEERRYLMDYHAHLEMQATLRVGVGYAAYNCLVGMRRLCRLYSLQAPALIIDNEELDYATTLLLHRYALSVQHTTLTDEECALMDEE